MWLGSGDRFNTYVRSIVMRRWQHEDTGRICEAVYCPGNRWYEIPGMIHVYNKSFEELLEERRGELIAAAVLAERHACATICERVWADTPVYEPPKDDSKPHPAFACALQIRARGKS